MILEITVICTALTGTGDMKGWEVSKIGPISSSNYISTGSILCTTNSCTTKTENPTEPQYIYLSKTFDTLRFTSSNLEFPCENPKIISIRD